MSLGIWNPIPVLPTYVDDSPGGESASQYNYIEATFIAESVKIDYRSNAYWLGLQSGYDTGTIISFNGPQELKRLLCTYRIDTRDGSAEEINLSFEPIGSAQGSLSYDANIREKINYAINQCDIIINRMYWSPRLDLTTSQRNLPSYTKRVTNTNAAEFEDLTFVVGQTYVVEFRKRNT